MKWRLAIFLINSDLRQHIVMLPFLQLWEIKTTRYVLYQPKISLPPSDYRAGAERWQLDHSIAGRPAAVVNGLSLARSQGGGSLILAAAALPPNCHLPDILRCQVSRETLKPPAADMRHFVGSYMWLLSAMCKQLTGGSQHHDSADV